MTPSKWRCRKAGLLLLALALAALCALLNPADAQSVQAMVKNQPFPYAQGVAMDTMLYKSVKAKLQAAETLRLQSSETIAVLQAEITGTQQVLADTKKLGAYDARQADSLRAILEQQQQQLQSAQTDLKAANMALTGVVACLPRRLRKQLGQANPDEVATAVNDYIDQLKTRKWSWAGVSAVVGGIGSLVFLLR